MAQQQPTRRRVEVSKHPVVIPDKLYFRIGDVGALCDLPPYVLRFWETEFPQLKPNKGGTGQRLYRKRDVELVLEIKRLLYDEGFTIAGARRLLGEKRRATIESPAPEQKAATPTEVVAPPRIARTESTTASKPARGMPPASAKPGAPDIRALRAEMRDLLDLLGSDPGERKSPAKREAKPTKKTRVSDEPTLF